MSGFCEVQCLCYDGSPNWLGWLILGFGALLVLGIASAIFDR